MPKEKCDHPARFLTIISGEGYKHYETLVRAVCDGCHQVLLFERVRKFRLDAGMG